MKHSDRVYSANSLYWDGYNE